VTGDDEKAFRNVYEDAARADAYARLEFPGTYFLAYRDLPSLVRAHVAGGTALDFGCGASRSTRFLRGLGFQTTGVDVSGDMIRKAREIDPAGDYRLIAEADFAGLGRYDLVLASFTFDNIPQPRKSANLTGLAAHLSADGRFVNLVSSPEIYVHEWLSFSTRRFPENARATTGSLVRIVMLDSADRRPVEDVVCTETAYLDLYRDAGLERVASHAPLGRDDEPFAWVSETRVAPWRIDVLRRS
jgi:SAM-dependent methyltransferase